MVFSKFHRCLDVFKARLAQVRANSKRYPTPTPSSLAVNSLQSKKIGFKTLLPLSKNGITLVLSALLGAAAQEWAEQQGVQNFLSREAPPQIWWTGALKALGYQKTDDSQAILHWTRYVPESALAPGSTHVTFNPDLLIRIHAPDSPQPIELWTCGEALLKKTPPPRHWSRLGSGWEGALRIQKCALKSIKQPPLKTVSARKLIDPKEIRY